VALIFTLILLAKAVGMTTPLAIAQWVRLRAKWLREVLSITRKSFPCAATSSHVLRAVDGEQVNEVLMQALTRVAATQCCGDEASRLAGQGEREQHVHVALDGKTLRGTDAAILSPRHFCENEKMKEKERERERIGDRHGHLPEGFCLAQIVQPRVALVVCDYTIENRLHWRRDVTMGEGHSQVRTGDAPQVLAALNNAVLALMDWLGVRNVPVQMRTFDVRPHEALRILLR
jgi:hypothetical protein